jgi:hypothetical protein
MSTIRMGIAALIVVGLAGLATGCSGGGNAGGTGGTSAPGAAGTTGAAGTSGDAGTNGSAGTTGAGGGAGVPADGGFMGTPDASVPYAATCAATVSNKGLCMTATDVQCANTCGPNKSGYKNCDCFSDVWDCPRCEYRPGNYDCYKLPDPLEACPTDANGELPQVGTACTRAPCSPCGHGTLLAYRDSGGSGKIGYCVCGNEQKWTCASTKEWPQ